MKKLLALPVAFTLLCSACAASPASGGVVPETPQITSVVFQNQKTEAFVNLKQTQVKAPRVVDDVMLVPVRVFAEHFGAEVGWDEAAKRVSVTKDGTAIEFVVGENTVLVNGEAQTLGTAPVQDYDAVMVPVRPVAEAFGLEVSYDGVRDSVSAVKREGISPKEPETALLQEARQFVMDKTKKNAERIGGKFIDSTEGKLYKLSDYPGWTAGFYAGLNYLCNKWSGEEEYIDNAKLGFENLKRALYAYPKSYAHDVGFVFMNSFYQDYLITGSEESREVVLDAANVLMKRYKPEGYIQAWDEWGKSGFGKNNQYRMIIDTMCNLPLLFTAYDMTGDETYYNAAVSHADMAQKYLVRNDYTTAHTFLFNPDGTPNRRETHQGYADDSCWARGQAWCVNGFAQAYLITGNKEYLNTAVRCCDVFLQKTDTDLVPRWDMVFQNNSSEPKDSSAAGILSCGMMDLWEATGNRWYKDAANQMFEVLYENYSSKDDAKEEGLILHATGNKPGKVAIDCSLIYGDMYFAQLIDRLSE